MQSVIRNYSGANAAELFNRLEANAEEVQSILKGVSSFVSYTLVRTDAGGFSVTIAHDQAGIDESNEAAKNWVIQNAGDLGLSPPEIIQGSVILHAQA